MHIKNKHTKLPIILLLTIIIATILGKILPIGILSLFYTISLIIKEILLFLLPFIIFSLIFSSIIKISQGVLKLVILLIPTIILSNFVTTITALSINKTIIDSSIISLSNINFTSTLLPLINFSLPTILANEKILFLGLLLGIFFSYKFQNIGKKLSFVLDRYINIFLHNIFIPIIPLFIFGFVLKLQYDGMLYISAKNYASIFALIVIFQIMYVGLLYGISANFNVSLCIKYIKNILPAGMTGFVTMSSIAALPLNIIGSEKNLKNSEFPKLIIPSTVNIHLIGDCIAIPTFAIAIIGTFGSQLPNTEHLLIFAIYFVIAKFAVASVPGGGILVMLPILEKYLGFTPAMLSLITALYIMLDCVITSINVIGNGAFVIIFHKIYSKIFVTFKKTEILQKN